MDTWRTSWNAFIEEIRKCLQEGMTLVAIGERLVDEVVRWKGQLAEKALNESQQSPSVLIQMDSPKLEMPDKRLLATEKLRLFFDNDPEAIAPWWHAPIGTIVEFTSTLSNDGANCVEIGFRSLQINVARNPVLVNPSQYREQKAIPNELYATLRKPVPAIVRTIDNCRKFSVTPKNVELPSLDWTRREYGDHDLFRAEVPSGEDSSLAIIAFWLHVLGEGSRHCTGDWRIILINARPEAAAFHVQFCSDNLQDVEPVLFDFVSPELAEGLLKTGLAEWDKGLDAVVTATMSFIGDFWESMYAALCSEPVISQLHQLALNRAFRIFGAEVETDKVIELKVPGCS